MKKDTCNACTYHYSKAMNGKNIRVMYDGGPGFVMCETDDESLDSYASCLSVDEGHRKKGLGTLLMDAIEDAARDEGMKTMTLDIEKGAAPWLAEWYVSRVYRKIEESEDYVTYRKTL